METKAKRTNKEKHDPRLWYTPDEIATNWAAYAEREKAELARGDNLTWGVKMIDEVVRPLGRGNVWALVARPGHGKSTCALYLARRYAQTIAADPNEIIIYITFDQTVEELETLVQAEPGMTTDDIFWGRADIERVKQKAMRRVNLPIWFFGYSAIERRNQPRMTAENIFDAIQTIEREHHKHTALIVLDYIQNMPVDGRRSRTEEVTEAVVRSRELVLALQTRMITCVQAARDVDDRDNKIPQVRDCQHASAIEQDADAVFGLWRPILTETDSALTIKYQGRETDLPITDNLFVIGNGKQRKGKPARNFYTHFDPLLVRLSDLELHN